MTYYTFVWEVIVIYAIMESKYDTTPVIWYLN